MIALAIMAYAIYMMGFAFSSSIEVTNIFYLNIFSCLETMDLTVLFFQDKTATIWFNGRDNWVGVNKRYDDSLGKNHWFYILSMLIWIM